MQNRLEGPPLTVRGLQEFIAFARTLNVSETARDLYIAQSTLSTHLQKLERDLGVALINHGQKPTLTPAGTHFLEYAENIVCSCLEAAEKVRQIASASRCLVIEEPQNAGHVFEATVRTFSYFESRFPDAKITLRSIRGRTPIEAIVEGTVDVAKLVDRHPPDSAEFRSRCAETGIAAMPISQEAPVAWMESDHPLATRDSLAIRDLKNIPVLVPADVRYDDWRQLVKSWFDAAGETAAFNMQVTETLMEFYLIKPGRRVFILPESLETAASLLAARGVVPRPIRDDSCRYYISLAYAADSDNPLLPAYLDCMRRELEGGTKTPGEGRPSPSEPAKRRGARRTAESPSEEELRDALN